MWTRFYKKTYWVTLLWSACFSKISRPFCGSRNWSIVSPKYWDLLQPYSHDRFSIISRTFYASRKLWIIIVFLQCMLKEKLPIFLINTLLLHIPLLALTDGQNYGQRNKYPRYAWAGGTFFPVVLLYHFLFWREQGLVIHT